MNRTDLNRRVALQLDLPIARGQAIVDAVLTQIGAALHQGYDVRLAGFGTLRVVQLAAREGTGPDGKPYRTAARPTVRFAPARGLEENLPGPAS